MNFRVKCEKYLKGRNYTVKKFHKVKFCQIAAVSKNYYEKGCFYKTFNGHHVENKTFKLPEFSLLSFVYITQNFKSKCLTYSEVHHFADDTNAF